ncbi:hypothetical protein [Streptomyces roseochromogenus]|uniref:Uncharacterized protein n=1 Tax=Streptomyces roseochromogenus subsp. oscitans DS 12.976 TaxID=1352936 RepID=V6L6D7_STRRC|nr:hypothetical protein [Streptomyces roseochromogenus]EST36774.1 hypothetical protein M878_00595 [Streptomyces roseochromogenus subsp. oscitans DS 12.976]
MPRKVVRVLPTNGRKGLPADVEISPDFPVKEVWFGEVASRITDAKRSHSSTDDFLETVAEPVLIAMSGVNPYIDTRKASTDSCISLPIPTAISLPTTAGTSNG